LLVTGERQSSAGAAERRVEQSLGVTSGPASPLSANTARAPCRSCRHRKGWRASHRGPTPVTSAARSTPGLLRGTVGPVCGSA